MYSRRGFLRKLRKLAASEEAGVAQHSLLVTSIDWYAGIRARAAKRPATALVNTAARAIKRAVGDSAISAYFGDGRFATLLVGQSPAAAKIVAESLAKDFGSRESHHESIPRPTLTSAVVPWTAGNNADQFLNEAMETLDLAVHSGGDCVVLHGEFNKELAAWQEEMATGNPFANVVAQDIMEPFPRFWNRTPTRASWPNRSAVAGIPVRPYVDHEGRLVGIAADDEAAAETPHRPGQRRGRRRARQARNHLLRRQLPGNLRSLLRRAAARRWSSPPATIRLAISPATDSCR